MSEAPGTNEGDGIRPFDVVVSVTVIFVLALAQPLLDLLGRNAEFFLARSAPPLDIVLLAVALTLIIPITIGFFIVGVRHVHEPTGRVFHGLVLAFLAGVLVLQLIELLPLSGLSPWLEVVFALGAGAALAVAWLPGVGRLRGLGPRPDGFVAVRSVCDPARLRRIVERRPAYMNRSESVW